MRKIFNKIICFTVATVAAVGVLSVSACSNVYKSKPLNGDYTSGTVSSNGGFAVEKGNYIYFINGQESNTADNTYGKVEKGAIMRISKDDFANRNYSSVDTVVPQIAYSGNSNAGIFIYGDYVYYSTPSTEKNSDGEVLNSYLTFKSSKLDGTEAMKNNYLQYSDNTIEYRYVEDVDKNGDKSVYLIYVAKGEKLYGETTGVTNIHSVNTKNPGEDNLLAYNVDEVTFDKNDLTNPRVYYTMKVTDFEQGKTFSNYNQLYTVTAGAKGEKANGTHDYDEEYDNYFTKAFAKDEDGYNPEKNPRYYNCGELVLDGIGLTDTENLGVTPFNGEDAADVHRTPFTYSVSSYQNGHLFYVRTDSDGSDSLYDVKESEFSSEEWSPVKVNDKKDMPSMIDDSSAANSYNYIFDENDEIDYVLITTSYGFFRTVIGDDGKLVTEKKVDNKDSFYIPVDGMPTVLFFDYVNSYIYYSTSNNANGYSVNSGSVNRVKYDGKYEDYVKPVFPGEFNDYDSVCVLDLDTLSGWYKPEMFEGQILFLTDTENMADFPYVMACNLRDKDGKDLSNEDIKALNDKYNDLHDKIEEIDDEVYENLPQALIYGFYANESGYIDELIQAYVKIMDYDEQHFWSAESVKKFKDFVAAEGDWADYAEDTVEVNGVKVTANKRDYYYSLLGKMTDGDAQAYSDLIKANYLQPYPEKEQSWFEGLSDGEKAGFIIGVVVGGLLVIAGAVILTLVILRKRKEKLPTYKKKRIKVDTTDDKDVDVYSGEQ